MNTTVIAPLVPSFCARPIPAAIGIVPEIAEILAALSATDGVRLARMSGSGATCFALYDGIAAARQAAEQLAAQRPAWWSAAGRLIGD